MRRLFLTSAALMAMASAAAAQSSGPAVGATPPAIVGGNGAGLNGTAASPLSGNRGASCTADAGCASFPLTPPGAASPSLAPRTSPIIGASPNQTSSAVAAPPLVAPTNPTGGLNQANGPNPSGGLDQAGGLNRTGGATATPPSALQSSGTAGTPATRAPAMSSSAFQAQCANSLGCSAFQGQ